MRPRSPQRSSTFWRAQARPSHASARLGSLAADRLWPRSLAAKRRFCFLQMFWLVVQFVFSKSGRSWSSWSRARCRPSTTPPLRSRALLKAAEPIARSEISREQRDPREDREREIPDRRARRGEIPIDEPDQPPGRRCLVVRYGSGLPDGVVGGSVVMSDHIARPPHPIGRTPRRPRWRNEPCDRVVVGAQPATDIIQRGIGVHQTGHGFRSPTVLPGR